MSSEQPEYPPAKPRMTLAREHYRRQAIFAPAQRQTDIRSTQDIFYAPLRLRKRAAPPKDKDE